MSEQKQPELECVNCGKHTANEQDKGYMLGGKFYCWKCAGELLKMEDGRK